MSDQIHLRIGAEPWLPADAAKIDKVLNHYDIPLAGIIAQHRKYYIFECLEGHGQDSNVWAYAPISRAERREIRKAKGEELQKLFDKVLTSRTFVAVLAIDCAIEIAAVVERDLAPKKAAATAIHRKADTVRAARPLATC